MDAIQYLLSLEKFGIKFGLDNIRTLCTALGEPQTRLPERAHCRDQRQGVSHRHGGPRRCGPPV